MGARTLSKSNSNSSETNSPEPTSSGGSFSGSGRGAAEGPMAPSTSSVGLRRAGGGATSGAGGNKKKRFVGVRQRPSGRWVAEIKDTTQKIRLWLGTFDTAEDAARAYDEAAWLLRGANTRTNFVPSPNQESSALPSKAARLLQLRRSAAAKNGNSPAPSNNNSSVSSQDQLLVTQSTTGQKSVNVSRSSSNSKSTSRSQAASVVAKPKTESSVQDEDDEEEEDEDVAVQTDSKSLGEIDSEDIGAEKVSKSVSDSVEDSSEAREMDGIEESPAPEHNATSSPATCLTNQSDDGQGVFVASDDETSRSDINVKQEISRPDIFVKQEIFPGEYVKAREPSAIKENRKENDYCVDPSLDDTDMSSGLSCLDDVDLSCEDSVYDSSPFDFSADMGTIDVGSFIPSAYSAEEDPAFFSEQMRRMSYERRISANLYAMNGVHECLSISSQGSDSYGMASPSLSLAAGFRRSASGPFLTASPVVWKRESNGSTGSSWGTLTNNSSSTSTGNGSVETLESPREDALWQSWDLSPLCVVA
jgi:hypothetical protein